MLKKGELDASKMACSNCGSAFEKFMMFFVAGDPFCPRCEDAAKSGNAGMCKKCSEIITGKFISIPSEGKFHAACVECSECKIKELGTQFRKRGGLFLLGFFLCAFLASIIICVVDKIICLKCDKGKPAVQRGGPVPQYHLESGPSFEFLFVVRSA